MRRYDRNALLLITTALLVTGVTGCSTPERDTRWVNTGPAATPSATASTAAPAPVGHAPQQRFAVGVRELGLNRDGERPLPVTIWYPADGSPDTRARESAPAADGRFPVVMFSHGLQGRPDDYQVLLSRWAAAGFVVAAPTFPGTSRGADRLNVLDVLNQPADVSYALTALLKLDERPDDPLRGRLATDRVAAAGHSAGGVTTIGLFTTGRDERLDAGVVLAGSTLGVGSAFAGAAAPLLFVHGEQDDVVSYQAGKAAFEAVPWPKAMLSLPDGDHGRGLLADDASLRVVADTSIEFLRWTLYGDQAAKRRLPADATRGGLARLDNHL